MNRLATRIVRFLLGLRCPSADANRRRLASRGDSLSDFRFREATAEDIPGLVSLHVETWNDTYPYVRSKPTHALRERQWKQAFEVTDGSWFCWAVEDPTGRMVGFAKAIPAQHPEFSGELSKIYLLRPYQRLGLGRMLIHRVAERFLSRGVESMILFAEATNPSCKFYEALGAEKIHEPSGAFRGTYAWRDLHTLAGNTQPNKRDSHADRI